VNTVEFLQMAAAIVPERGAIVEPGGPRYTFEQTAGRVARLANALQSLGFGRGDRLAVMSVNSAEYVVTYFAAAALGVTFVPLNYRSKDEELTHMLNVSRCSAVFVSGRYVPLLDRIRPTLTSVREYIAYDGAPDGYRRYEELLAGAPDEPPYVEIDDEDPTVLMFTSGTTAMPKGVQLTYLDLTVYVANTMGPADPDVHEKTLVSAPFFHIAGTTAMLSSTWGGRTLVILPAFTPEDWLRAVAEERVTHAFVVPTMLKRIMDVPDFESYDLSSLQLLTYGAAPMPYEVVRRACDVFPPKGIALMNAYGQTESTSTLTYLAPEDHDLATGDAARKDRRLRSVGRAMEDVEIAIMDEANRPLAPGLEGEICVRSERVMKGYHEQEAATSEAIVDGWLHTGDVGLLDDDGYLFITGRKKDLIIRGGENISPGEIEATLASHPAIEDAAVIGVPDPDWGEVVKAVVVPVAGMTVSVDEIVSYAKAHLASFKAPQYVAVVDSLPRNVMGKVLKNDLRALYGGAQHDNVHESPVA
jgi:acyl-CoA synthetase (AMP-forming)/AMP-acid ligase II